ncbi:NADH-quinone oxidoreductase subunit M [Nocardioides sp. GY 10127]|uniref:NADH-quinone oxidoreductase subunit M n=1 Tax=Nocardioides sp. GY 10127 TaxID=2569762 RepID=UPI0010A89FA4|nr:NADH-quinone oxidoreductase subunit M [Nocardioides sp. GY 10127]TIC80084.1 NADH-quinone oxidoreductase subunit M [Nocardioides sp. GY 10127]
MDFPWLSLTVAVPLVGALVVALSPRTGRLAQQVGLTFSLVTLALAVVVATQYQAGDGMQLTETYSWIPALGVHLAWGVDGLGLLMILLAGVLVPIVLVAAWNDTEVDLDGVGQGTAAGFTALVLALEGLAMAVFLATDVFLFYLVFEATLIPAYFLVGGYGREGRSAAAVKFLVFQLGGGLVMLAGVVGLYVVSAQAGTPSYLLSDLMGLDMPTEAGRWLFVAFFTAFAVKAPLFPVHTWLADTTGKATPATSVLLVSVLDKIGTFGMLRFCLGIFPEASQWATPVVVALALISIVYGAFLAIGQDDLMRLIGLTSLSHFGFITLGIFVFSTAGASGAVLYMVNHGVGTAALFLVAGFVAARRGTTSIRELGGLEKVTPVMAAMLLIAGLATLSLPGLSPFVSEFLVLIAAFQYHWFVGAIAVTAVVLAAIYILWMYQRTMTGPPPTVAEAPDAEAARKDLGVRELVAVVPLVVALVGFGFFPQPLLKASNDYVGDLLTHVGVVDDSPTVPVATGTSAEEGEH